MGLLCLKSVTPRGETSACSVGAQPSTAASLNAHSLHSLLKVPGDNSVSCQWLVSLSTVGEGCPREHLEISIECISDKP